MTSIVSAPTISTTTTTTTTASDDDEELDNKNNVLSKPKQENNYDVYDDKWHHGNVKYTTTNKRGVKSGARKKDMQKPVSLR